MDPNDTAVPDTEVDTAAAAATQEDVAAPAVETAADPADPFMKGVEEATGSTADPDELPVPANDPPAGDPKPDDAPAGDPPATEPKKEDPKPDEPPAPAPDVEAEIKDLGITNERTQKRFRELSERAAEAETLRAAASKADEWEQTVASTGANPQQFGNALNYLAAINSGNPDAMNQAYDAMQKELQWLGEKLGREAPGFDPLSVHPDLEAKVKAGDLPREVAAEIAQHRQRGVLQQEHSTGQIHAQQAQLAEQQGVAQVAALGQSLRATDPDFQRKFQFLMPTVELVQKTMPPEQWAAAIHQAYQRLPALPAAAPAARPASAAPIRPSGAPALAAKPKNDIEAFSFGVEAARQAGR